MLGHTVRKPEQYLLLLVHAAAARAVRLHAGADGRQRPGARPVRREHARGVDHRVGAALQLLLLLQLLLVVELLLLLLRRQLLRAQLGPVQLGRVQLRGERREAGLLLLLRQAVLRERVARSAPGSPRRPAGRSAWAARSPARGPSRWAGQRARPVLSRCCCSGGGCGAVCGAGACAEAGEWQQRPGRAQLLLLLQLLLLQWPQRLRRRRLLLEGRRRRGVQQLAAALVALQVQRVLRASAPGT